MKHKLGHPLLRLCLFFPFLIMSCATVHAGKTQLSPMVNKTETYQLQVRLIVHDFNDPLAGTFTSYLVDPIYVQYFDYSPLNRTKLVTLFFRFTDLNELQQCREQLVNTGYVQQISMTKY